MSPVVTRATDTGTVDADNPWPGLAAFREADHQYFQGRETVVDELEHVVVRSKLTVLHGVSGLGKTSLLRAGLFPRLRVQHVLPIYVRLSHAEDSSDLIAQVWQAIDDAAGQAAVEAPPRRGGETLWESFHRKNTEYWDARNRIVMPLIVFDQFEEIFTTGRANAARRARTEQLLDELCDLVEGRPSPRVRKRLDANPEEALHFSLADQPCKVLISLREDFLSDLTDLRPRMPAVTNKMYRLRPMTSTEALRVVEVGGRLVDREVAESIVRVVGSSDPDAVIESEAAVIEPALLSVFCRELNNKRRALGQEQITARLVEGNRADIIREFYKRTISADDLSPDVRILVEEDLITESGFRNSVAEEQALVTRRITRADIDALIASRLLRREDAGTKGRSRLELTHDVLADAVRVSRDRRRILEKHEKEAAERWTAEERGREEAERARKAAEMARIAQEEQRAREAAERIAWLERRGRRRQLVWSSVVLVLIGTLGLYAWNKAGEARVALSAANLDRAARGEPRALAYLARAVRDDPDSVAARALLISHLSRQVIQLAKIEHDGPLLYAAIDTTGARVLTRAEDGVVRLWDAGSGQPIQGGWDPATRFTVAAFSPDGSRILTVSHEGRMQLWDASTGTPRGGRQPDENPVSIAAFDRTGKHIVTVSQQRIGIWDLESGARRTIDAPQEISDAFVDPTGTYVLSLSASGDANVWHVQSGNRLAHLDTLIDPVFSADGLHIVAAFPDGAAQMIDTRTGARVGKPLRVSGGIGFVGLAPDDEHVITTWGETAQVWNALTGEPIGKPLHHAGRVFWAGFSPEGERVLTASEDGTARLWDVRTGLESGSPLRHSGVVSAAFSANGSAIVTASNDGTAHVWDARTGMPLATRLRHHRGRLGLAAISRDGAYVAAAGSLDVEQSEDAPENSAHVWETALGRALGTEPRHSKAITSLEFDKQLTRIVTASDDGTARIWNLRSGVPAGAVLQHAGPVLSAKFSPDGTHVVTVSGSTATVWNVSMGKQVGEPLQHRAPVVLAAFIPDGSQVITVSADGTASVWTTATGTPAGSVMTQEGPVVTAALNARASHLVTVSERSARLWDVSARQLLGQRLDHNEKNGPPAFSPDGHELITMPLDVAAAVVRDVHHGLQILGQLRHATNPVVAASSDAGLLTATEEGTVHLWDVSRALEVNVPLRHSARLSSAAISDDGSRILVVDSDGVAWVRDVLTGAAADAEALAELAEVVGGYLIDTTGELTEMPGRERQDRLAALRARAKQTTAGGSPVESFVKWLLGDPATRTVSPLSRIAVPDYIQQLLSEGESGRREAQRLFPGHPALAKPRAPGS